MSEIRKLVAFAISDPGHAGEGYKGDRSLTEWQTDAVMRVVSELEKANVGYVDANTALIARIAALSEENERLRTALGEDITEEMVDAADSVLSRSRPGIPDHIIKLAIAAAFSRREVK